MSAATIIAVSTPPGPSRRGLLRCCGDDAFAIAGRLLATPLTPAPFAVARPGRLHWLDLPVLVACFGKGRSFTGDDLVELQMPGHPALLEQVIKQALDAGATLAQPGEFTFRAFASGRIDLTRAEGVAATIAAVSDAQLRAATQLRRGSLGGFAAQHVDQLAHALALVEAGIDFVDQDDVVPIAPHKLADALAAVRGDVAHLLQHARSWGELTALPRVVLVGPPSAGKSTLFNALLGGERAVIDEQPGTTRDILAEPLTLRVSGRSVEVMLVDLAGLDDAAGDPASAFHELDRAAQVAARREIEQADVILSLSPVGAAAAQRATFEGPVVRVQTKCDVLSEHEASASVPLSEHAASASENPSDQQTSHVRLSRDTTDRANSHSLTLRALTEASQARSQPPAPGSPRSLGGPENPLRISAHTGENLDVLQRAIVAALGERHASVAGDALALQPRHAACLRRARASLDEAVALVEPQREAASLAQVELIASAMRDALDALADLGGAMTPDDVIGKVFATFCVGK